MAAAANLDEIQKVNGPMDLHIGVLVLKCYLLMEN